MLHVKSMPGFSSFDYLHTPNILFELSTHCAKECPLGRHILLRKVRESTSQLYMGAHVKHTSALKFVNAVFGLPHQHNTNHMYHLYLSTRLQDLEHTHKIVLVETSRNQKCRRTHESTTVFSVGIEIVTYQMKCSRRAGVHHHPQKSR